MAKKIRKDSDGQSEKPKVHRVSRKRDPVKRMPSEKALRESEAQLRSLSENIAEGMVYQINSGPDGKERRFTYLSPAVERLHGLKVEEVVQNPMLLYDQVAAEDRPLLAEREAHAHAGRTKLDVDVRVVLPSGEVRWRRFTSSPRSGEDGSLVWDGIEVDITERKQVEEEVAKRGAMLQQIMDTASAGIFLVDKTGRIVHANKRMAEMFGCTMEELIGSEYVAHVHPSERETSRRKMLDLLASEIHSVDLERYYWRKDGSEFWGNLVGRRFHDVHGNELGLIGVIYDITKRKRAEEALRTSEERLTTILDNVGAYIFIKDTQYRYTYVNRKVCDLFGMQAAEILGKGDEVFFSPASVEEIILSDRPVIERGETVMREETDLTSSDKVPRTYWTVKLPLRDSSGTIYGICGISTDITEIKRAEEALRESENRMRSIIESIPVGMHMYRLEPDGRLVFIGANPAADRILGVDHSFFIDKTIEEAFPPLRDTVIPQRYREVAVTGKTWQTEHVEYEDNAIRGAFEVHAFRTWPNTMVAAFEEISERKRAEMALKESEEKYRRLYNETPVLLHSIDRNRVLVDVNDYWLRTMGYERSEVIGRKVTDFYTAESRKYAEKVVQPAFFRDGIARDIPYQFIKKNGEVIDVLLSATAERDDSGSVVRSQAVITDVTDRKRMEEALQRSEARYRMLYEGTPVMMHSIDTEGKLISVSDHWLRTLGYTRDEVLGRRSTEFLDEQSAAYARTVVLPDFMKTGVCTDIPYTFVKKNGERISTLLSAIAERDRAGKVIRSLAVIIDITERKRAEEMLKESEVRFRRLVEQSPIAITIVDKTGRIEYLNRKHTDIVGYLVDEVPTLEAWWAVIYPNAEIRQRVMTAWGDIARRVLNDEDVGPVERQIACKDGSIKDVEMRFSHVGEKILVVFTDISERKRAEEEARRNEALMTSLYRISQQSAGDEQAFLDFALHEAISFTGSSIGYLYYYDEAKREFTLNSYSRDVMRECSIAERKTCYELDRTGIWGEAVRQRKPILLNDFEAEHPLKKGYPEGHARLHKFLTVPVIMEGAVVAVIGVANKPVDYVDADVLQLNLLMDSVWKMTQRVRAERALQESEERFRDLAESLPLTVFEMDLQGRFTYVNRAALEKFGYTQQDVEAGLTMAQVIVPGDREKARQVMARRLRGSVDGYVEYQALRKDGTMFPITVASGPILRDGRPVGLRGIVSDLTERKELEEERMKREKLEATGMLAGGIAHDFNNLLQGIFGYISMTKMKIDNKERSLELLEQAEKALHLSVNLTTQLLTFSKGGRPVKKLLKLRPVIENAVRFALSGSRSDYRFDIAEDLLNVEADEGQIGQVIQNIAINADQSMPFGGTVRISARNMESSAKRQKGFLPEKAYVEIAVQDSGVGIPRQYLSSIFDPYFTTKEKGSGIGLATTYSIIRNHGGLIDVESEVGKGSTFFIYLPGIGGEEEDAAVPEVHAPGRSGKVLVMDDDLLVRTLAREMIKVLGHEAVCVPDGEAAVAEYRLSMESANPFDVVILDLTIRGGMGGEEAIRSLLALDPHVRAVVSSGYSEDAIMSDYQAHGFRACLGKPYRIEELRDVLNSLLT